jgi:hypothetical protein
VFAGTALDIPDLFANKGEYTMHLGFHGSSNINIDAVTPRARNALCQPL